jgi:hypothetical protein
MLSFWVPVYGLSHGLRSKRRTVLWPAPTLESPIGAEHFFDAHYIGHVQTNHSPLPANTASATASLIPDLRVADNVVWQGGKPSS